jgi:hypothetical protein
MTAVKCQGCGGSTLASRDSRRFPRMRHHKAEQA